jgi:hypothetical protein
MVTRFKGVGESKAFHFWNHNFVKNRVSRFILYRVHHFDLQKPGVLQLRIVVFSLCICHKGGQRKALYMSQDARTQLFRL